MTKEPDFDYDLFFIEVQCKNGQWVRLPAASLTTTTCAKPGSFDMYHSPVSYSVGRDLRPQFQDRVAFKGEHQAKLYLDEVRKFSAEQPAVRAIREQFSVYECLRGSVCTCKILSPVQH